MKDESGNEKGSRLQPWQVQEIKKGLAEANRDEFASEEQVEMMFDELTR